MTKSRKESFIFKKQTKLKTRRPSAGFEDTGMHRPGSFPLPRPRRHQAKDPQRTAHHAGQGGQAGPLLRETKTRAPLQPPLSLSGTQANSRLLSASAHWALPYQAGLLDKGWRTSLTLVTMGTLLSGKGRSTWADPTGTGPLALPTIPGISGASWNVGKRGGHMTFVPNTQLSPQVNQDYNHNSKERIVLFFPFFS